MPSDRYRDEELSLGLHGPVMFSIMQQPMTVASLSPLRRFASELTARHGKSSVGVSIVLPGAMTLMSDEIREGSANLTRSFPRIAAAVVIEGEGFGAAMARAAMGTVMLISRTPYPMKAFGAVDDAITWLRSEAKKRDVELPNDLGTVIEAAR